MKNVKIDTLAIEDARLIFRNFSGRKTEYNRFGRRSFSVILPDGDLADNLKEIGWNVKTLKPRDEEEEVRYFLDVTISFDNRPPNVYMITKTNRKKTRLDEDTIDLLDTADIVSVDIAINPYHWEINNKLESKSGIKAYLKTMYVTIDEDEFEYKYADEYPDDDSEELPFK